jgi:hypothetical protein
MPTSTLLRAVIRLVAEHVSAGEIEDVLATLPKSIRALWHDLAGDALQVPPRREALTRRTGYSR